MINEKVRDILGLMKPCLATKDYTPILKNFYFKDGEVVAFDGVQAAAARLDLGISGGITGNIFLKLIDSLPVGNVILKQKEDTIIVKSGTSRTKLPITSIDEFIYEPVTNLKEAINFDITDDFVAGIKHCLISAGDSIITPGLNGVTLRNTPNSLYLYSTDGMSISRYSLKSSIHKSKYECVIPGSFCMAFIDWWEYFKEKGGKIFFGKGYIQAVFDSAYLFTKVREDIKPLDFEEEIGRVYEAKVPYILIPEDLTAILDRSSLFVPGEEGFVTVNINKKGLLITAKSGYGKIKEKIKSRNEFGELSFTMNLQALKRVAPYIEEMSFVDDGEGGAYFFGAKSRFLHLIHSCSDDGEE
jgi:DNA polymerase III sliding clamp (beta) subunit (PCNA family)